MNSIGEDIENMNELYFEATIEPVPDKGAKDRHAVCQNYELAYWLLMRMRTYS